MYSRMPVMFWEKDSGAKCLDSPQRLSKPPDLRCAMVRDRGRVGRHWIALVMCIVYILPLHWLSSKNK